MRLLILSTNSNESGAPKHVETLSLYLRKYFDLLVVFGGAKNAPVKERLSGKGLQTLNIPTLYSPINPLSDIKSILSLASIVRSFRPNIISCHSTKAGFLARIVGVITTTPVVFTVHGWGWRGLKPANKIVVYLIELFLNFCSKSHYIFVDSCSHTIGLKQFPWIEKKSIYIPNGVKNIGFLNQ